MGSKSIVEVAREVTVTHRECRNTRVNKEEVWMKVGRFK